MFKEEFNFTDNKDWLLPFLLSVKQNKINDIEDFAIKNVEKIFKKNMGVFSIFSSSTIKEPWKECAKSYTLHEISNSNEIANDCRESPGFDKKFVPTSFSYNNSKEKSSNEYKQSVQSYDYLRYSDDIQMVIGTPGSDYTRRDDVLHKYRLIDYLREKKVKGYATNYENWIDILIFVYKLDQEADLIKIINEFSQINDDNKYVVLKINAGVEFNGNINTDLRNGVDKLTEGEATIPVKIPKESKNPNSFFNGGKSKKKTRKSKKRKSKTSKKTSKKRTIKRKRR